MLAAPDRETVNHREKRKEKHRLWQPPLPGFSGCYMILWCSSVYCPFSNILSVRKLWKFVRLKHRATKKCWGSKWSWKQPCSAPSCSLTWSCVCLEGRVSFSLHQATTVRQQHGRGTGGSVTMSTSDSTAKAYGTYCQKQTFTSTFSIPSVYTTKKKIAAAFPSLYF